MRRAVSEEGSGEEWGKMQADESWSLLAKKFVTEMLGSAVAACGKGSESMSSVMMCHSFVLGCLWLGV